MQSIRLAKGEIGRLRRERAAAAKKRRRNRNGKTLFSISGSPHIRQEQTVQSIMRDVVIALLPSAALGFITLDTRPGS
ncbi:MAG: hypothetical protein ACLT0Y_01435 [Christensenellales bacterium]